MWKEVGERRLGLSLVPARRYLQSSQTWLERNRSHRHGNTGGMPVNVAEINVSVPHVKAADIIISCAPRTGSQSDPVRTTTLANVIASSKACL